MGDSAFKIAKRFSMWWYKVLLLLLFLWTHSTSATVLLLVNTSTFTFDSREASFAPHVKGSGVSGSITFGNPADACSSLDLSSSTFLLTMRGNCSFEAKARFAQDAGFAAVIIYNNESGSDLLTMTGSSEGISVHAVFVTRQAGETMAEYTDDASAEVCILATYENVVWSVVIFSLISLLAVSAVLITWYIVKRHRERRFGRFSRRDEPCLMSLRIVQAMPSMTYRVVGNEKAAQEACVICLEDYINGEPLRILPCSHRFHCSCVDVWLTMWRAVCPICKRDARYEFPDLQVSERTPLLSFSTGGGRGFHVQKEASSSESPPIQIPPSHDADRGYLDIPSCSKGTVSSSSRLFPSSISNSLLFRRSSAFDGSLEAFRASPYFTPPSLSHNTSSHLLPGSYAAPSLLDCSPAIGSPSSLSSGPQNTWSKSFLNPSKGSRASLVVGSSSPHSCGSQTVS